MNIEEKILLYKEELDYFEDKMDKYKYLLEQGKKADKFPEEYRKEAFLVSGCQAQVWLVPLFKNGILDFYSDSDAFISKGMVTILCDIYGNKKPNEIMESNFEKLNILDLDNILTPSRRNGVHSMLNYIKKYAEDYKKN
ncbi:MAG: Cysteine desulfuration protein SufE [Alphaproteobacteria bacterium MarineAlpha5_Bin12]|nr:Fe-S metabolism associated SufE [Pelagibacteraceae bacterium]PPR42040.1 MAG: Cysteine desulfuration protein SufE [Alphaproteobacteria bacterium MarineAlpha5_Bin12]|tara:strand:+ start:5358 stop:5774 length:417 start_codon:yes stop_codon:yes gene_type:complete